MAETGDILQEWHNAKPPEKVVIVLGGVSVVGVAIYLYMKGQAASANSSNTGAAPPGQTAGFPMAGNVPVLPSGTNPLYDPNGNLIGFQNSPTPTPPVPAPPGSTQPVNWYTNILGKLGYGTQIRPGGVDANGQRFWTGNNGGYMFYAPPGSTIQPGAQGRMWITTPGPGGSQQLLTGPGMTPSNTNVAKVASH